MVGRWTGTPAVVALATVDELPAAAQRRPNAEYLASRVAARRAIRAMAGDSGSIEVRRRVRRSPLAQVRGMDGVGRPVALSLTHRDGRAAALAAPPNRCLGVDLERLGEISPSQERYFLTSRERRCAAGLDAAALWSIKEAVWKAMELGRDVAFRELELELTGVELHGVRFRGRRRAAVAALAHPWPGYVLATVQLGVDR